MEGVDWPRTMALTAAARVASLRGKGMVAMQTYKILRYGYNEEREFMKIDSGILSWFGVSMFLELIVRVKIGPPSNLQLSTIVAT